MERRLKLTMRAGVAACTYGGVLSTVFLVEAVAKAGRRAANKKSIEMKEEKGAMIVVVKVLLLS
jgi:hypothetical protein